MNWTGDLNDDCTCHWNGYVLRAECMGDYKCIDDDGGEKRGRPSGGDTWRAENWWIAVYLGNNDLMERVFDPPLCPRSGDHARKVCELFAKAHYYESKHLDAH